ncbi:MAG: PAS domain S-box protein, partial [Myxococcota bacterium]
MTDPYEELRQRAAHMLQEGTPQPNFEGDRDELLHELQVQFAELELQAAELSRSREKLIERNGAYHDLFHWSPNALMWLDPQGGILKLNHQASLLLGDLPHALHKPPSFLGLLPGACRPPFHAYLETLQADSSHNLHVHETQLIEGNLTRPIRLLGRRLPVRQQHAKRTLVELQDRSAEAKTEIMRALLENAVVHTSDGVMITDADLDDDGPHILYVNDAICQMTGYSIEELLGATPRIFQGSGTERHVLDTIRACLIEGRPFKGELTNYTRDGKPIQVELHINPMFDFNGIITHYTSILKDITLRKEHERRNISRQRLEAIGSMAGGIAHDFNNILTVITSVTWEGLQDTEGTPVADMFSEIDHAVTRAAGLTRQLLTFSRQGSGNPITFCASKALSDNTTLLRRLLPEHIELRLQLGLQEGEAFVTLDRTQFDQLIINLATNAREAILERGLNAPGHITLSLEESSFNPEGIELPSVWLKVSDTGIGIAPDIAETLFEPFSSTRLESGGSGLGLATVYGIVVGAGGSIDFQTDADTGTTFQIHLPLRTDTHGLERPPKPPARRIPARVALVEDNQSVRTVLERGLQAAGHHVRSFARPGHLLELLHTDTTWPEILITDVVMPDMSGAELAQRVRLLLPSLPVLVIQGAQCVGVDMGRVVAGDEKHG